MTPPTGLERQETYERGPAFFLHDRRLPVGLMQEHHGILCEAYTSLGIDIPTFTYLDEPLSAYGVMKQALPAAGFLINGADLGDPRGENRKRRRSECPRWSFKKRSGRLGIGHPPVGAARLEIVHVCYRDAIRTAASVARRCKYCGIQGRSSSRHERA